MLWVTEIDYFSLEAKHGASQPLGALHDNPSFLAAQPFHDISTCQLPIALVVGNSMTEIWGKTETHSLMTRNIHVTYWWPPNAALLLDIYVKLNAFFINCIILIFLPLVAKANNKGKLFVQPLTEPTGIVDVSWYPPRSVQSSWCEIKFRYVYTRQCTRAIIQNSRRDSATYYNTRTFSSIQTSYSQYSDVVMSVMASQITSLSIAYSIVYSGARKYQSSASLAFVRGIHRWPVNYPHKWPVKRKPFPFEDVISVISPVICNGDSMWALHCYALIVWLQF